MKNETTQIRKIVKQLNCTDGTDGGFWLPDIQRNFVWKEDQIERLFDSLMREYPIGTLLIWKTKSNIKYRKFIDNYKDGTKFIDNYKDGTKFTDFYVSKNENCKLLVLDGQQRLQSLFIGLCGSYNGKELYFNVLSGFSNAPEDVKYIFKFRTKAPDEMRVKVKDLVFSERGVYFKQNEIFDSLDNDIADDKKAIIGKNIDILYQAFKTEERIIYQAFDSVDRPELYNEDDVVEIFIRANSGGTPLGKSDLLFSLLTATWEEAEDKMDNLLEELNKGGYAFTRDFVLKTCLTLLKTGASYKITKFRDPEIKKRMMDEWDNMEDSIKTVRDFLYESTYLRSKKAFQSYLALIPVIYFCHRYKNKWNERKNLDHYILKTLLAGSFGGSPDSLIDNCIKEIDNKKDFNNSKIFNVIRNSGRSLQISKDDLLQQNYSSNRNDLHLLFNLWYKDKDYNPSYEGNELSIDHIFPTSILKTIKLEDNPQIMKYKKGMERDKIGNLMLLTKEENGAGGKGDMKPSRWFNDKDEQYLKQHLIPNDPELWKIENFDSFLKARELLITKKFRETLGVIIQEKKEKGS